MPQFTKTIVSLALFATMAMAQQTPPQPPPATAQAGCTKQSTAKKILQIATHTASPARPSQRPCESAPSEADRKMERTVQE